MKKLEDIIYADYKVLEKIAPANNPPENPNLSSQGWLS